VHPVREQRARPTTRPAQRPQRPQQYFENNHSGPSTNDRIMNGTNTLMSRGMSMLNDGRPSMPVVVAV
jgi:hypothetical protein